jgi:hypothetical protein
VALIAGIGRWRRRYVVPRGASGLSAREAGGVMRTALSLVTLPDHEGKSLGIEIAPPRGQGGEADAVWALVEAEGSLVSCDGPLPEVDGHGRGPVHAIVDTILDGPHNGLCLTGDEHLVTTCFERLHQILWRPEPDDSAEFSYSGPRARVLLWRRSLADTYKPLCLCATKW